MLDGEELVLNIKTGVGAIRKLGDKLEARDELGVLLGDLIGEGTWNIGLWLRKFLRLLEDDAQGSLLATADDVSDAVVATMLAVTSQLR
jgi:hypothetical protein